jgi:hypothetical protein
MNGLVFGVADDSAELIAASAALRPALARVEGDLRPAAWQDGLDLLAVIAGLKPVCAIGRGAQYDAWVATLSTVAKDAGLPATEAAPWDPEAADVRLPDWYLTATARRRESHHVLYIGRDGAAAREVARLSTKGRVDVAEEAALLGYPPCCVAEQHSRTLDLERLVAEMTERVAQGDRERMIRMIAAGAAPLPLTRQDWERYSAAVATRPAASTSVNMCGACAADRDSPAQMLSRRYGALAALACYPAP